MCYSIQYNSIHKLDNDATKQVLDAERMTRWDATVKVAVPTDMVKVVLRQDSLGVMGAT